jgi:hypothetical protein
MHVSDYQQSMNFNQSTYNPTSGRMAFIRQNRMYRFKQIWCLWNWNFNGTGNLYVDLNFWVGEPPTLPLMTTGLTAPIVQPGILAGTIPIARARPGALGMDMIKASFSNTSNLAVPMTEAGIQAKQYTNVSTGTGKLCDIEIVCDTMTVDVTWDSNQFAPQCFLISIGSNHPANMYAENHFSP